MTDLGGGRDSLPCIVCKKPMRRIFDGGYELQPSEGLHFSSTGAYGSTAFDPDDLSTLDVIICDECIVAAAREARVLLSQPRIGLEATEDGLAVGYYAPERESVPWDPDKRYPPEKAQRVSYEEIAQGTIPVRAMVKASAIRRAHEVLAGYAREDAQENAQPSGAERLRRLQAQADPSGYHRGLRAWVDDHSGVARVLRAMDKGSDDG